MKGLSLRELDGSFRGIVPTLLGLKSGCSVSKLCLPDFLS